jgi:predicted RNase H-like nuclease (RuvC/YqgF family)
LEEQRRKLKAELKESYARQQRLLRQIDVLEEEQRVMVDGELQNIEELEKEERHTAAEDVAPLLDVASEQIVFPNDLGEWSFTSLSPFGGSLEVSSGSS